MDLVELTGEVALVAAEVRLRKVAQVYGFSSAQFEQYVTHTLYVNAESIRTLGTPDAIVAIIVVEYLLYLKSVSTKFKNNNNYIIGLVEANRSTLIRGGDNYPGVLPEYVIYRVKLEASAHGGQWLNDGLEDESVRLMTRRALEKAMPLMGFNLTDLLSPNERLIGYGVFWGIPLVIVVVLLLLFRSCAGNA